MRNLVLFALCSVVLPAATPPDVSLYESVLQKYVLETGKVNYAGLKADKAALDQFVAQVGAVSPDSNPELFPTREAKFAYWINAYNALVLQSFTNDYPEKRTRLLSELGKLSFFYRIKHNVGGKERTLDDIEVNSMRKVFGDPRVHMAIVCASTSCPWLSPHAYTAANLNQKLDEEAKRYFSQTRNFKLDPDKRVVYLPKIFDWFNGDFVTKPE